MSELWAPVPGYVGKYEVSSLGRVRSLDRVVDVRGPSKRRLVQGRVLKPKYAPCGYLQVALSVENAPRYVYIHTLVCEAFIGPRPTKSHQVDHVNADRTDNRLSNLRWVTVKENHANPITRGRFLSSHATVSEEARANMRGPRPQCQRGKNKRARPVVCTTTGECFPCILDAMDAFDLSACAMYRALRTNKPTRRGLRFSYMEQNYDAYTRNPEQQPCKHRDDPREQVGRDEPHSK